MDAQARQFTPHVPPDSMLGLTIKQTVRGPFQNSTLFNMDGRDKKGGW